MNLLFRPTTRERLGARSYSAPAVGRCEQLPPVWSIRTPRMFPTGNWKKAGSSGWEWLKRSMPAAHGGLFGRKTVVPPGSREKTFTMLGSLKDLERTGEKIH